MDERLQRQRPPKFASIKKSHPEAYKPWTRQEDALLREEVGRQVPVNDIARVHRRQPTAIRSRIAKLDGNS